MPYARRELRDFARTLAAIDGDADAEALARLDAGGFLLGPGESVNNLRERALRLFDRLDCLDAGLARRGAATLGPGMPEVGANDRIDSRLLEEAGQITERLYGFRLMWAPGFYLAAVGGGGWRWRVGCAWGDADGGMAFLGLRREFRDRARFAFCDRAEILSHELCHLARWPFGGDERLEEFYAYRTSKRPLRRYLGNCFASPRDAPLFVSPVLALMAATAARAVTGGGWPIWPFWTAAMAGPLYLLGKNRAARARWFRAERNLRRIGVALPSAVLFRCVWEEMPFLAAAADANALRRFAREQPDSRWRVIERRFLST